MGPIRNCSMKNNIELLYLVNAHIPNDRANGVQIVYTCENLGKRVNLSLATRVIYGDIEDCESRYGITQTFAHVRIFCIDISGLPLRYAIRNASFFVAANIYVLWFFIKNLYAQKKAAVYVRGEVILLLIPLSYIIPIFFETHQIRNFEWLYRVALRSVRGIVVVTDRLKQKFVEEYNIPSEKIVVARDAVDLEKFESAKRDPSIWLRHGIPGHKKIVLYSGTLAEEKGVHTLAAVAPLVPSDIQLVFLGGTDEQVVAFKEVYGNIQNISILGRVIHTEVPQYVVSADLLVLPDSSRFMYSNLYTSPMKLFEYMASNVPILASDVPSLREVLDNESAFFFEADNFESLAQGIREVLKNDSKLSLLSTHAKEIVSECTWEKRAETIVRHIESRLSERVLSVS